MLPNFRGQIPNSESRSGDVYHTETTSILSRTKELLPVLGDPETEVLAVVSGLRPSREGGARVEAESQTDGRLIVHNYGAGGTGYQAGMGMAIDAVNLFTESAVTLPSRAVI